MTAVEQPETKPTVLLVDLSGLFWSAWHSSANETTSMARVRTLEALAKCVEPGDLMAICCDSGRSFRKDLSPAYKAQRPVKDHVSLDELNFVIERLRRDGHLIWSCPGYEADDVIATAAVAARAAGHEVVIASADKDLLQLVGPGVRVLRTHTWKTLDEAGVVELAGVPASQLGDWLALVGDKADNIEGAKGIGPKTAASLLGKFGSLDGILAAMRETPLSVGTPAIQASLRNFALVAETTRQLIALRTDAPISFEEIYTKRETQPISTEEKENDMVQQDAPKNNVVPIADVETTGTPAGEPIQPPIQTQSFSGTRPTMDGLTTSPQIDQIAAALAKAQGRIQGAKKDADNPFFKSKYADLASVWEACRAAIAAEGLAVTQVPNGDGEPVAIKVFDDKGAPLPDEEGARVRLTTLLLHKSGQWIGGTSTMTAGSRTPQAAGSCLTYLRRYSLSALIGVAPEDDDGNAGSAGRGSVQRGGR